MTKRDPVEEALNALAELRTAPASKELAAQVRSYLTNRSNLVVAKAAKLVGELRLPLIPDLLAAFHRMMANPAKLDKRCAATTAIISSLYELDYTEPDVYLAGIRHIQKEASYGPPVDTAAAMRGMCAQGLLRTRYPEALTAVVDLLVDPEPPARLGAVRALAANGGEAGMLLLRLKALTGDKDPEIMGECFSGLLSGSQEASLRFVAAYMDDQDEAVADAAIWALGQSRLEQSVGLLQEKWERTLDRSVRKTLVAALAASRTQGAVDYLCLQLRTTDRDTAEAILKALSSYAGNDAIRKAVAESVHDRDERALTEAFNQQFASE